MRQPDLLSIMDAYAYHRIKELDMKIGATEYTD